MERPSVTAQKLEILVAGTGPAGMIAALGLAQAGFAVTPARARAAPRRPAHHRADEPGAALCSRRSACSPRIADHAAPLKVMRIADATSRLVRSPTVTFRASEIGEDSFGLNMPNDALFAALERRAVGKGDRLAAIRR